MILTVTLNPSIDISYPLEELKLDTVNRVLEVSKTAGGKGLNVTRVLAESGETVGATGFVGGTNGQFIKTHLPRDVQSFFYDILGDTRNCIAILHEGNQTEILEAGPEIIRTEALGFLHHFKLLMPTADVIAISGSLPTGLPVDYYASLIEIAKEAGGFDFILADLGVSSMQIDNPKRGFSFKVDGPLDLRLNQQKGISAAERLDTIGRDELAGMLYENSDEPYCEELAKAITDEIRRGNRVDTTTKLRGIIEKALDFLPEKEKKETVKKTCQRVFQALRIDVNQEFEVLYEFMEKLPGALRPGGRAAILTFHSGEDKLVKAALKEGCRAGIYSSYSKDVVRPTAEECVRNPRARSTKMRWAVRAEE